MSCAFLDVLSRVLAAREDSLTGLLPNPIRSSPVSSSPPPFVNAKLTCLFCISVISVSKSDKTFQVPIKVDISSSLAVLLFIVSI